MGPAPTAMWKLTIEDDEGTKTLLPLVRDEYALGRDEKNTVRLTERNISRAHATLKKGTANDWEIIDNESYNGCYVNGQRVAGAVPLAHSDLIQLGDYRIFISNDAVIEGDTPAISGGPHTAPSVTGEPTDRLVVLVGPEPGLEYPLDQGPVTIGRAEECTISVNHPSVSRVHAEVKALGVGRYEILDRGSSNGVRVNGTDLRRALLEGGDLIELGDVKLRFIERGQVYRAGADVSQQIEAVTSRPAKSVRPSAGGAKRSMTGVIAVSLVVVAVLAVVGVVALRGSGDEKTAAASSAQTDAGAKLLDQAKTARASGDLEAAFGLVAQIPDSSTAKRSPDAQQIVSDWADATLKKAQDASTDKDASRGLLKKVAQNTSVDAARRKVASDLLLKLDSTGTGTDIDKLPAAGSVAAATPSAAKPDGTAAATAPTPTTTMADPTPTPTPTTGIVDADATNPGSKGPTAARPKDKATDKDKKDDTSGGNVTTQDGETAMRRSLEARVWGGRGSREDIKMLKAICQHQNDKACRDRASQMLKN